MKQKFARVPYPACVDKDLSRNDMLVLNALCLHADKNGECFPSYKTISEHTGIDQTKISRSLNVLYGKNYISRQNRRGKYGSQISNLYSIIGLCKSSPSDKVSDIASESNEIFDVKSAVKNVAQNFSIPTAKTNSKPFAASGKSPTPPMAVTYINELTDQYNKIEQKEFINFFGSFIKETKGLNAYEMSFILFEFPNVISEFCLYIISKYSFSFFSTWIKPATHKIDGDIYLMIYQDNFLKNFMINHKRESIFQDFFKEKGYNFSVKFISDEE